MSGDEVASRNELKGPWALALPPGMLLLKSGRRRWRGEEEAIMFVSEEGKEMEEEERCGSHSRILYSRSWRHGRVEGHPRFMRRI